MTYVGPMMRKAETMYYVPRDVCYQICEECIKIEFEAGTAKPETCKVVRAKTGELRYRCQGCLVLQILTPKAEEKRVEEDPYAPEPADPTGEERRQDRDGGWQHLESADSRMDDLRERMQRVWPDL